MIPVFLCLFLNACQPQTTLNVGVDVASGAHPMVTVSHPFGPLVVTSGVRAGFAYEDGAFSVGPAIFLTYQYSIRGRASLHVGADVARGIHPMAGMSYPVGPLQLTTGLYGGITYDGAKSFGPYIILGYSWGL